MLVNLLLSGSENRSDSQSNDALPQKSTRRMLKILMKRMSGSNNGENLLGREDNYFPPQSLRIKTQR